MRTYKSEHIRKSQNLPANEEHEGEISIMDDDGDIDIDDTEFEEDTGTPRLSTHFVVNQVSLFLFLK